MFGKLKFIVAGVKAVNWLHRGNELYNNGEYDASVIAYKKAAEEGSSRAHYKLGCLSRSGIGIEQSDLNAIEYFEAAAVKEHAEAQYKLGMMYLETSAVEVNQDCEKGLFWLKKASQNGIESAQFELVKTLRVLAEQGDTDALSDLERYASKGGIKSGYILGELFLQGKGIIRDVEKAISYHKTSAELGFSQSQMALVDLAKAKYSDPHLTLTEALRAVRKNALESAARNGDQLSQYLLARIYAEGLCVEKNLKKAKPYFEQAAAQGHALSQLKLGWMYANGMGVSANQMKAASCYHRAAVQGVADAQYALANMHKEGVGVDYDKQKAQHWYKKAAAQEHPLAKTMLKVFSRTNLTFSSDDSASSDEDEASVTSETKFEYKQEKSEKIKEMPTHHEPLEIKSLKEKAGAGELAALLKLGKLYYEGDLLEQDYNKARYWFEKAVEQDDASAQYFMGVIYAKGRGVEEDLIEAMSWYKKAAAQGYEPAQSILVSLKPLTSINLPEDLFSYDHANSDESSCDGEKEESEYPVSLDDSSCVSFSSYIDKLDRDFTRIYTDEDNNDEKYLVCDFVALEQKAKAGDMRAQYLWGAYCEVDKAESSRFVDVCDDEEEAEAFVLASTEPSYKPEFFSLNSNFIKTKVNSVLSESVKWYLKSAEQGYLPAQYDIGLKYDKGEGVRQDHAEAARWYLKAAEQGDPAAECSLGLKYSQGEGVKQDPAEAVKWYQRAADLERWHLRAQTLCTDFIPFDRGLDLLLFGTGFFLSEDVKYLDSFRRLAVAAYVSTQYSLALFYEKGVGVKQDYLEAIVRCCEALAEGDPPYADKFLEKKLEELKSLLATSLSKPASSEEFNEIVLLRKKAEAGDPLAQFNLALKYEKGSGVTEDHTEALKWYRKAAEQGDAIAQFNLALKYEKGEGVTEDHVEAVKWYRKAAEQGEVNAQFNLAVKYEKGEGATEDHTEALKWYRKAAEQGNARAQFNLAVKYEKGEGVTENHTEALKWYRKAAEQGNTSAQFNLAVKYEKGEGVTENQMEAVKWYRKAAEQGNTSAQFDLAVKYEKGEGVTEDHTEAVKWYRKAAEQGDAIAQFNLALKYEKGEGVTEDYVEAVKWYRKAAEQGDASAQFNLALKYEKGEGVTEDYVEAVKWYRKAAEQGDADVQCNLAWKYEKGEGITEDHTEAVRWYHKAAEQGDARAQYFLALKYEEGEGVTEDHTEAVKWYRKAAEQGHATAQYFLALKYEEGEGATEDHTEALKWYRKAAEQGNARAQFNLAVKYEKGEGVTENHTEAIRWYRKAAEQGHATAQYFLALKYEEGEGVTEDLTEAVRWYRKAAEQGDKDAQFSLAIKYEKGEGVTENHTEAIRWYRKAAEQGHAGAQCNLGLKYEKGKGVTENHTEVIRWYRKAAEQGDARAQFNLALKYEKGKGVTEDHTEALKWYRKAAEQGNASAQFALGLKYSKGEGVTEDYVEAVKWYRKAAEQGFAHAQHVLVRRYEEGEGVPKNYAKALEWYRKIERPGEDLCSRMALLEESREAAEQGDPVAQFNLASKYEKDEDFKQDPAEAVKWYRKSAEQGYADAQIYLAIKYHKGEGVKQDLEEALKWYTKVLQGNSWAKDIALEQVKEFESLLENSSLADSSDDDIEEKSPREHKAGGADSIAQYELGLHYAAGENKDYIKALKYYQRSAEQGYVEAQRQLARFYHFGKGVEPNEELAQRWYKKAFDQYLILAEQGDLPAAYLVAEMLANGRGVSQNHVDAIEIYRKLAEENNYPDAQFSLGQAYRFSRGVEQDYEAAATWYRKALKNGYKRAKRSLEGIEKYLKSSTSIKKEKSSVDSSSERISSLRRSASQLFDSEGKIYIELQLINYDDLSFGPMLGKGGFGQVFLSQYSYQEAAVKVFDLSGVTDTSIVSFRNEASIIAMSNHANVVTFYGYTLTPKYTLVMEYMPKGSLYDLLHSREGEMLGWSSKLRIAIDVAAGLGYLHDRDVLHCDLKSMNVLLGTDYRAKLADFGLSQIRRELLDGADVVRGTVATIPWMSPESLETEGSEYTKEGDMYSYGMLLWELVTGKMPYQKANGDGTLVKHWVLSGIREKIPTDIPVVFRDLITQCWEADLTKRPKPSDVISLLKGAELYKQKVSPKQASNTAKRVAALKDEPTYRWDSGKERASSDERPPLRSAPSSSPEPDYRWDSGPRSSLHGNFWDSGKASGFSAPPYTEHEIPTGSQDTGRHAYG